MDGFTAYWTEGIWVDSCSNCGSKTQRTVNLHFNNQETRFCESCAIAVRELLIAMTEEAVDAVS